MYLLFVIVAIGIYLLICLINFPANIFLKTRKILRVFFCEPEVWNAIKLPLRRTLVLKQISQK